MFLFLLFYFGLYTYQKHLFYLWYRLIPKTLLWVEYQKHIYRFKQIKLNKPNKNKKKKTTIPLFKKKEKKIKTKKAKKEEKI